ncbi:hypothetical protein BV25DRAFT_1994116 [Artomyces pyxidatus]|uniref:Uncharacterized protein n=1 Tax=Artomyces pyxidatus TaxID=48021 RepID=A0ACB8SQW2_9AGAM|nr:hypothetical protein BV25DRAFT_1994116 [Artomyces pyxidatus]
MEDDIVYVRTNPPAHTSTHGTVTGIALSIPKRGDEPSQTLRFFRSRTSVVHIGRAPASNIGRDREVDNALFRCPVISRRHAKIVFSGENQVQLTDLSSHHGTHVLKQGDAISKKLTPGEPISLDNGDSVTFGKTVGRDECLVRPVTAIVRLLHDEEVSWTPANKGKQPFRSSTSGRYGIFVHEAPSHSPPSSPSSSECSSPGEPDMSIDASDPPEEYPIGRDHHADQHLPSLSRLGLLQRLYPTVHPSKPLTLHPPALSPQGSKHPWYHHLEDEDEWSPSFEQRSDPAILPLRMDDSRGPTATHQRLESPSPASDPFVIGAFPHSRAASPSGPSHPQVISISPELESPEIESVVYAPLTESGLVAPESERDMPALIGIATEATPVDNDEAMVLEPHEHPTDIVVSAVGPTVPSMDIDTVTDARLSALDDGLVNLRGSVLRVHIANRKTQADQKAQADRTAALDKRVDETNVLFQSLWDRIEGVHDKSHDLREELATFKERIDNVEATVEQWNLKSEEQVRDQATRKEIHVSPDMMKAAIAQREDVKLSVASLHSLVSDLTALHNSSVLKADTEMQQLKAYRQQAAEKLAEIDALTVAAAPSLKRKRSVSIEEEDGRRELGEHAVDVPRQVKRSRRIVANVMHTAAAMTVGAVAAWSALAFA